MQTLSQATSRDDRSNVSDNSELSANDRVRSYNARRHKRFEDDDDESDIQSVKSRNRYKEERHEKKMYCIL